MLKRALPITAGVAVACAITMASGPGAQAKSPTDSHNTLSDSHAALRPGALDSNPAPTAAPRQTQPRSESGRLSHTPAQARPGTGLSKGTRAYVAVSAATLWKAPSAPRSLDQPALGNPARLDTWNKALNTTAKRRGLTGKTESQASIGDEVRVLAKRGSWVKVAAVGYPDPGKEHGYQGWVPARQIVKNADFGARLKQGRTAIVTARIATATRPTSQGAVAHAQLPFNARVPVLGAVHGRVQVVLPDGGTAGVKSADVHVYAKNHGPHDATGARLVATAKQFLGLKYTWGGTSAYGFDCSGLTYSVFRANGITLPRDAAPQSRAGSSVSPGALRAGDLLFFAGGTGTVHHVGLYIGGGKMIHAPNASQSVQIVKWRSWDTGGQFAGAKRFL